MTKALEHGAIITASARKYLSPLGFRQKGQSRLWYSDQDFWVAIVEFQPSGLSKGSYLNVGACWLWRVSETYSFDSGYRALPFVQFKTVEQFNVEMERLASRAADAAESLRDQFATISQIARRLAEADDENPWRLFHAAVAGGLAGFVEQSNALFTRLAAQSPEHEWHKSLLTEGATLGSLASHKAAFTAAIRGRVDACRLLKKLPQIPDCLGNL